jgi:hypothetical protein
VAADLHIVDFENRVRTGRDRIIDEIRKADADEIVVIFRKGGKPFSMLSSFTAVGDTYFFVARFLHQLLEKHLGIEPGRTRA